jgi:TolB-like protein
MQIWSAEIKEIERLYDSIKGQSSELEKELERLINASDENMVLVYARRCLEVIVTDLCENELKRPRKTEPLQGIIDKLNREEKIPSHIFASMLSLNSQSTFGAHPKEFYPEQVKPVLNNLATIIKWYVKYEDTKIISEAKAAETKPDIEKPVNSKELSHEPNKKITILLSGLLLAVAIIIVLLFIFNIIGKREQAEDFTKLEKSIAVLPFENMSDNEEYSYFGDAMTDEIIMQLCKINEFIVRSRTSVLQYKATEKTIPVIGRELNVNYLIEGSAQRFEDQVRIRVQLIHAPTDNHIWGEVYEGSWKDIFSVQSEVAQNIARELHAVITTEEKQLIEKIPTENLTAYDLLLKARSSQGMERLRLLDEALSYDSSFAAVYAEKGAWWLWYAGGWKGSVSSKEVLSNALPLLTKALEIDPNNAEAHYGLAGLQIWYFCNFEASENEYEIALQLNPSNAEVIHDYTDLLDAAGRFEEALEWSNKGVEADPTTKWEKGLRQYFMNQYDEAIETYKDYISSNSDPNRYTEEARVRLYLGHYKDVISIIDRYLQEFPDDRAPRPLATLAIAYFKLEQFDKA